MRVSKRQAEILDLIALGYSDKLIARDLAMSKSTVRTHLERLFNAHGWHNRAAAAAAWAARPHRAGEASPGGVRSADTRVGPDHG